MKAQINPTKKYLVAGQLTLVLGILCPLLSKYFMDHYSLLDFLSGAFLGISMVMNLTFLLRYCRSSWKDG